MVVTLIKGTPLASGKKPVMCDECKKELDSTTHADWSVYVGGKTINLCSRHLTKLASLTHKELYR